ncbi:CRF domain-containing protein [Caerostris darwini]|uniref:CRF domain-containing protein n=1 Tax=Caerostris darwini TaxID=1538125 RepID=A0AAV4QRG3_9ARAC|nr:CRF domain-containing protein [Caerostris darwini]
MFTGVSQDADLSLTLTMLSGTTLFSLVATMIVTVLQDSSCQGYQMVASYPLSSNFEERQLHRRESVNKAEENAPAYPELTSDMFGTNSEESSDRIRMHEDNDSSLSSDEVSPHLHDCLHAGPLLQPPLTVHQEEEGSHPVRGQPLGDPAPAPHAGLGQKEDPREPATDRGQRPAPREHRKAKLHQPPQAVRGGGPLEGRQLPGLRRPLCRLELLGIQEQKSVNPEQYCEKSSAH